MVKKIVAVGMNYVREMEVEDVGALKMCALALGALIGIAVPARSKKPSALLAAVVFVTTGLFVMSRLCATLVRVQKD